MTKTDPSALVTEALDAFNRDGMEGLLPYLAEDIVYHSPPGWMGDQVYHGHEGAGALATEWAGHFVDYRWELAQPPEELEDGRVLVLARHKGSTRAGVVIDSPVAYTAKVHDDLVVELHFYTWEAALAVTGRQRSDIGSAAD